MGPLKLPPLFAWADFISRTPWTEKKRQFPCFACTPILLLLLKKTTTKHQKALCKHCPGTGRQILFFTPSGRYYFCTSATLSPKTPPLSPGSSTFQTSIKIEKRRKKRERRGGKEEEEEEKKEKAKEENKDFLGYHV